MSPVLNSLPFDDIVVWDNSREQDLQCYGRFAAISRARHEWIYTQDDDLLVPIPGLLLDWGNGGPVVFANKPPAEEWRFLGCGALFHRDLVDRCAFDRYLELYPDRTEFHRVADVVFAYSLPYTTTWVGYADLPWQTAPNRMYLQDGHYESRIEARERTLALNGS